jgi:hypothetical protein
LLIQGINPLTQPGQLFLVRGGVNTIAASVAAGGTLIYSLRTRPGELDGLAPAVVAGLGGWHLGCLVHGSCLGAASNLPWAFALPGSDVTRHPVEIYTALALLLGALLLLAYSGPAGTGAALAVAIISGSRLMSEPLRLTVGSGLWPFYLAMFIAGLLVFLNAHFRAGGARFR